MRQEKISDEVLNAFVDGQLEAEERLGVLGAAQSDEELAARICTLREIKELTRLAYANPPQPPSRANRHSAAPWPRLAAAAAMLATIGSIGGWAAHGYLAQPTPFQLTEATNVQTDRFILHLSDGDASKMEATLNDVETLYQRFEAAGQTAQIEVVFNGEGLKLLNADASPYGQRIRTLLQEHNGIAFLACAQAMERMELKGRPIQLLPQVKVIDEGALERIITRIRQGWSYIKV